MELPAYVRTYVRIPSSVRVRSSVDTKYRHMYLFFIFFLGKKK